MSSAQRVRAAAWSAAIAVSLLAGPARASNEAAAEALFTEAKKLVAQKKYAEACPKFAESNRLDRGAGTLIHLADCYEKNKQTASAWATYKEAASAAQALNRKDWETLAHKRAAALEPKLAHITVRVPEPVDKIEVARNGEKMTQASWGVALPVDVGAHAFEATAPGHKPFNGQVTVAADGESKEIVVPKLEALPEEKPDAVAVVPSTTTTPAADKGAGDGQRLVGLVVGGVGVAGLVAGGITGLMAMNKNNEGKAVCPEPGPCGSQQAVDDIDSAKSFGTISTIAFGAGAALVAAGAVLYLTAPSKPEEMKSANAKRSRLRVTPGASPYGGSLLVGGTF